MATTLTFPPGFGLVHFDGTNWPTWSNTLSVLLCMNGMKRHLTHDTAANVADPAAVQLWDQQEEVLLELLSLNVTAEVYSQIVSDTVYPTVHDKYGQLQTVYGTAGAMATYNLWVSLTNAKLVEGTPFLPQLQHQMSFILLNALPISWQSNAGTILASSTATTPLTPQDLIQRFVNEESRISGLGNLAPLTKVAPIKKSYLPKGTSPPFGGQSSEVTCFYCKKAGHKANKCNKKKKDLENAKKGKQGQKKKQHSGSAPQSSNTHIQ